MKVVDFHCDVLYKLLLNEKLLFSDTTERPPVAPYKASGKVDTLDVTAERLRSAQVALQTFAVYIPPEIDGSLEPVLVSIDLFKRQVAAHPDFYAVRTAEDLDRGLRSGKTGALLSLEGAGCFGASTSLETKLSVLHILFQLGVRAIGLTWNHANWAADGVMESRGGGLTEEGKQFVKECNRLGIVLDVSHLSDRAFDDMLQISSKPVIASHSNSRSVCAHPRNLTDDQIRAIVEMDGRIGLNFYPPFVKQSGEAAIEDLLAHLLHFCRLGAEKHIMLGSDFDGINEHLVDLAHPGHFVNLQQALVQQFGEELAARWMADNALTFLQKNLPREELK